MLNEKKQNDFVLSETVRTDGYKYKLVMQSWTQFPAFGGVQQWSTNCE